MRKYIKFFVACFLLAVFTVSFVGCNTMRGLGQDIERGGQKIQGSSGK